MYYSLAFVFGIHALESKNDSLIGWMVYSELIVHAIFAVACLGTSSGFQYYVYVLAFLPFFNATYSQIIRAARFFFVVMISLSIEVFGYSHTPIYQLDNTITFSFQLMNLLFFLVLLGVISFYYFQETERYQKALLDDSFKDPLTKLFNRRFILQKMDKMIPGNESNGLVCSFILLDVDFFKKVNDQYGHNTGDAVLIALAKNLQQNLRTGTIVSRWGGEEFLISCSVVDKISLKRIMERLRSAVQEMTIHYKGRDISITITLGAAISQSGESFSDTISRADQALYAGKEGGRNQSVIAG